MSNENAVKCSATGLPNKEKILKKQSDTIRYWLSIIQMQRQPDMYNYVH